MSDRRSFFYLGRLSCKQYGVHMTQSKPLKGTDLIDCAKANAKQGIETATQLCGYGRDTVAFSHALRQACDDIGVSIRDLNDLVTDQQVVKEGRGIEVAPDTPGQL